MATDEEKMLAAVAHASGCFVTALGPFLLWVLKKDSSPFVAYHALQATVFHVVAMVAYIVLSFVTCGMASFALPLFWLPALFWAYKAYQGSTDGYPGLASIGRPPQLEG